jgi:hypothetical protein
MRGGHAAAHLNSNDCNNEGVMPTNNSLWIARLREFTMRNASRPATLEIDDADMGAQKPAVRVLLHGVGYDPHHQTVEVMLSTRDGAHFTHTVPGTTGIEVLAPSRDRREILRIAHAGGQTLLCVDYPPAAETDTEA